MSELKQIARWFTRLKSHNRMAIIFGFMLLFLIVAERPGFDPGQAKNSTYLLPDLKTEAVSNVVIVNPQLDETQVILTKEDGRWLVANGRSFPADEAKVNGFLKQLYQLSEAELVSANPERLARFKVDAEEGVSVRLWEGSREIAHFYAGSLIHDGQYFRHEGSDRVVSGDRSLQAFLGLNKDQWKDKLLFAVDEKDVKRIALLSPDGETIIERELEDWFVISPEAYQPDLLAVRTLFEQLKKIEGLRFADSFEQSQADFETPDYRLSIRLKDDSLKTLSIDQLEGAGGLVARGYERDVAYIVTGQLVDHLFKLPLKNGDSL